MENLGAPGGVDLVHLFGPLASMHAALDRYGAGLPCGVAAFFASRTRADMEAAIAVARLQFPVLQTRLAWQDGRPVLHPMRGPPAVPPAGPGARLVVPDQGADCIWRHELIPASGGIWFTAIFAHAVADGMSMLRLLLALNGHLTASPSVLPLPHAADLRKRQPNSLWLPAFLASRLRRYHRLGPAERAKTPGMSWVNLGSAARDSLLAHARAADTGMTAWLAAAAALAFRRRAAAPKSPGKLHIHLNLPVTRTAGPPSAGFGFHAGSLLLPLAITGGETQQALAAIIAARQKKMLARGWDLNFETFLGPNPRRHLRFAEIEARIGLDPLITVSWKGIWPGIGGNGAAKAACFGVASTLHISAHADQDGLSLSLTSWQHPAERDALLQNLLDILKVADLPPLLDLAGLGAGA